MQTVIVCTQNHRVSGGLRETHSPKIRSYWRYLRFPQYLWEFSSLLSCYTGSCATDSQCFGGTHCLHFQKKTSCRAIHASLEDVSDANENFGQLSKDRPT